MVFTEESSFLLHSASNSKNSNAPEDKWNLTYIVYFTLGLGYLLPWNAFITVVDYFSYLYPDFNVDRIFAVVYMLIGLVGISLIILYSHASKAYLRINVGLALFVVLLLLFPMIHTFYVKGRVRVSGGFYATAPPSGSPAWPMPFCRAPLLAPPVSSRRCTCKLSSPAPLVLVSSILPIFDNILLMKITFCTILGYPGPKKAGHHHLTDLPGQANIGHSKIGYCILINHPGQE